MGSVRCHMLRQESTISSYTWGAAILESISSLARRWKYLWRQTQMTKLNLSVLLLLLLSCIFWSLFTTCVVRDCCNPIIIQILNHTGGAPVTNLLLFSSKTNIYRPTRFPSSFNMVGPDSKTIFALMTRYQFNSDAGVLMTQLIQRSVLTTYSEVHSFIPSWCSEDYRGWGGIAGVEAADEYVWQSVTMTARVTRG